MLSVLSFLFACQTMEEPGAMFKQVKIAETTESVVTMETKDEVGEEELTSEAFSSARAKAQNKTRGKINLGNESNMERIESILFD